MQLKCYIREKTHPTNVRGRTSTTLPGLALAQFDCDRVKEKKIGVNTAIILTKVSSEGRIVLGQPPLLLLLYCPPCTYAHCTLQSMYILFNVGKT